MLEVVKRGTRQRSRRTFGFAVAFTTIALVLLIPISPCYAGVRWEENGVAICTATNDQEDPRITSEGSGGAIITWADSRDSGTTGVDIYARRVDSSGSTPWTADGEVICNATGDQFYAEITTDGSGGAIITWLDLRDIGTTGIDIYAQRVDSNGSTLWTDDGIPICTAAGNQWIPYITTDGSGGAIIIWRDERTGPDIYAQRVDSNGSTLWTDDGIPICDNAAGQTRPRITSDGSGSAVITWLDYRDFGANSLDIYAQRVDSSGNRQWEHPTIPGDYNGVPICTAAGEQQSPEITPDGSGGAIITWFDYRDSGTTGWDIYVQRVDSSGNTRWNENGTPICTQERAQYPAWITPDGSGGAIITWDDYRDSPTNGADIYAQRVDSSGNRQWEHPTLPGNYNGVPICTAAENQYYPELTTDGSGGAIITWKDERTTNGDIYAQRVNSSGDLEWNSDGVSICAAANKQNYPKIISSGSGGAIIAWEDERSGTDSDIYAQRVADDAPVITSITPNSGHVGTIVTIEGSGFGETQGSSRVNFGHWRARRCIFWSDTQIRVRVPQRAYGRVGVRVWTPVGYSNSETFYVKPAIKCIVPRWGRVGTTVTIYGSAFGNMSSVGPYSISVPQVYFGTVPVKKPVYWNNNRIRVRVPKGVSGVVPVWVKTSGGCSNEVKFMVIRRR